MPTDIPTTISEPTPEHQPAPQAHKTDIREKIAFGLAIAVSTIFFTAALVASTNFGVQIPTCVTTVQPFTEGKIIESKNTADKRIEVQAVAKMWVFDMGDDNAGELRIPVGSEVNLYLTSSDVVHGFHIEGRNVNLMAIPGAVNNLTIRFDHAGTYPIICHEYCGIQHQAMAGVIKVLPTEEYNKIFEGL
jgi:cytochrome c oxidase subunit II